VSPFALYYRNSIVINFSCEGLLGYQMYQSWKCFKAVINACATVQNYYLVTNDSRSSAPSYNTCTNAWGLHALWMMANLLLLLLRFISAIFMLQGLAYLQRRMKEKERKVERQL
jgi:hypothetical protein